MNLSKRKLESYRRAEKVAQASRHLLTAGANPRQDVWDLWSGTVLDWMAVTGKQKYEVPKRRKRSRHRLEAMMKAISIRQPWAWLILHAGKDIENRDWYTNYRGRILIHASKGMTKDEYEDALDTAHTISLTHPFPSGLTLPAFDELPRGGIVGWVEITDCVVRSTSPWFFGRYGFALRNPRPLAFTPYKGALGLFDVPELDVAA